MQSADRLLARALTRLFLGTVLGLLIGLGLMAAQWAMEGIHRLDFVPYLAAYCGIGAFSGFVIGLVWAVYATRERPDA
jgi:hypothetical protein